MSKFAGYFQSKSGNSGGNYNQRPGQAGDNGGGGESVVPNSGGTVYLFFINVLIGPIFHT